MPCGVELATFGRNAMLPSPSARIIWTSSNRLIIIGNLLRGSQRPRAALHLVQFEIEELARQHHHGEGDREEDEAGILVIEAAGELRETELRDDDDGENSARIADDREEDGEPENRDLLPHLLL